MNVNKNDIEKVQQAASARWGNWVKYVIGAIIGGIFGVVRKLVWRRTKPAD